MRRAACCCLGLILLIVLLADPRPGYAEQPLHERIDHLIAARHTDPPPAPLADDAAFLRRVWLDLAGRIPPSTAARQFLDNAASDKRVRLIDQLLAAPTYAQRMQELFHVLLMERRGDHEQWDQFLQASFAANKPWDQLVRELLRPDDQEESRRGAAFFYTKRLESYGQNPVDYPGLTSDVGRLLLGVDLQCAQCHDHLFIDDYKQQEFQGLFAIYQNTFVRTDVQFPAVGEKPITQKLEFVSAFDPTQQQTGPRVPFGRELPLSDAEQEGAQEGASFSALALLAEQLPRAENELFTRNIVNRLWFVMMGHGLVHPLDQQHAGNPASHPELLDLLAREFAAQQFDIQWLLRELALTQVYQRSSRIPDGLDEPPAENYGVAREKRLSAEQLLWSTLQATGELERLSEPGEDGQPGSELQELKARFLKAFANPPREPEEQYNATVKAALFQLNDDKLLELLRPRPGNLVERLVPVDDSAAVADELFLSIFSRRPTEEETSEVAEYLATEAERREVALGHIAWAMLTSMEFCVNH